MAKAEARARSGSGSLAYSVVIPVFNEEENLPELYRRLTAVMERLGSYEVILVDDGSTDGSYSAIKRVHQRDPRIKAVKLSRNFGHHVALTAGMDYARGAAVILMDADLQDQPEEIPKLTQKLNEDYDVVYGIRENRKESLARRIPSYLFMTIMNRVTGSGHFASGGVFRVMTRQVVNELQQCRETSRFITGLVGWLGFDQVGVEVEHGARFAGQTKYNLWRLIKMLLNTLTSFTYVPLQLASWAGLITALVAVGWAGYYLYRWVFYGVPVAGFTSTILAILILGAVQLIVLGLIGEYLGRVYTEAQRRPLYIVKAILDE
jgi:glycosyltransferase involved in cell wall biosynthesis